MAPQMLFKLTAFHVGSVRETNTMLALLKCLWIIGKAVGNFVDNDRDHHFVITVSSKPLPMVTPQLEAPGSLRR